MCLKYATDFSSWGREEGEGGGGGRREKEGGKGAGIEATKDLGCAYCVPVAMSLILLL